MVVMRWTIIHLIPVTTLRSMVLMVQSQVDMVIVVVDWSVQIDWAVGDQSDVMDVEMAQIEMEE